jgi:DNA-binding MarR family transcriptional regulator
MNSALHALENDGYIERRPHPRSRRADSWSLTDAGVRELERAREVGTEIFTRMMGTFDATEIAALEDYLRRCITALGGDAAALPQEPPHKRAERRWRRGAAG